MQTKLASRVLALGALLSLSALAEARPPTELKLANGYTIALPEAWTVVAGDETWTPEELARRPVTPAEAGKPAPDFIARLVSGGKAEAILVLDFQAADPRNLTQAAAREMSFFALKMFEWGAKREFAKELGIKLVAWRGVDKERLGALTAIVARYQFGLADGSTYETRAFEIFDGPRTLVMSASLRTGAGAESGRALEAAVRSLHDPAGRGTQEADQLASVSRGVKSAVLAVAALVLLGALIAWRLSSRSSPPGA